MHFHSQYLTYFNFIKVHLKNTSEVKSISVCVCVCVCVCTHPHMHALLLANELPDWSYNELLDAPAGRDWTKYYPDIPFSIQPQTKLVWASNLQVTTGWQQFRYEFMVGATDINGVSLPDKLLNTFPCFIINSTIPEKIYIDEVQVNLIEE